MKFLIVGLGSMGKRRIRCLRTLGYDDITGYDPRSDRRAESVRMYDIKLLDVYKSSVIKSYDAVIISTPPDMHYQYASDAVSRNVPCFIEASVIPEHVAKLRSEIIVTGSYVAPSCTMKFHSVIKQIKKIVKDGSQGKVTNYTYHSGQYLYDWHPWEKITDFYVTNRKTGAAREIVPFELTWLTDVFGFPGQVKGFFSETMKFERFIENSYVFSLRHDGFLGSITVDVVSRFATRSLIINFEKAQLRWNWEDNGFKIFNPSIDKWEFHEEPQGNSAEGYNKNIKEEMYVREIEAFVKGVESPASFPNNIDNDMKILGLLCQIEDSDGGFERVQ